MGFDFSTPAAPPEKKRWDTPDVDWGLMAKFPSQKKTYEKIFAEQREYDECMKRFKETQQLKGSLGLHSNATARLNSTRQLENQGEQCLSQGFDSVTQSSSLSTLDFPSKQSSKKGSIQQKPVELVDHKVSKLQALAGTNPEVLAQWRAQRAAQFVSEQKDPFNGPPSPEKTHSHVFRPSGAVTTGAYENIVSIRGVKKNSGMVRGGGGVGGGSSAALASSPSFSNDGNSLSASDAKQMKAQLLSLVSELNKTEDDLQRQQLKIGLQTKVTGGYLQPKGGGRAKSLVRSAASQDFLLNSP